jgi:hypothetical protein
MLSIVPIKTLLFLVLALTKCDAFVLLRNGNAAVSQRRPVNLFASSKDTDQEFWAKQKELVAEMQEKSNRNYKQELREKFAKRRLGLVTDTAYFGFFIFCGACFVFIIMLTDLKLHSSSIASRFSTVVHI